MTLNEYFTEFKKKSEGGQQLQQQQQNLQLQLETGDKRKSWRR